MNINTKQFLTIDTHTGGNPTRTVLTGMPELKGNTIQEKMLDMKQNHDHIRKFLVYPPRGHDVMSSTIVLPALKEEADFSVIFAETGGYLPMCGHDTIGTCTALVELGYVEVKEPVTTVVLDTPAGVVEAECKVTDGKVEEVTFVSTDAFHLKTVYVDYKDKKNIKCDIAYGGNFYGIIKAEELGLTLEVSDSEEIVSVAMEIRDAINAEHTVQHPEFPFINKLTHMELYTPGAVTKNAVIVPPGGIDRSPCGTGTRAKVSTVYKDVTLGQDEACIHESITGSQFKARLLSTSEENGVTYNRISITGSVWIMGRHDFYLNENDPLNQG